MIYKNTDIRRQDRLLEESRAKELLRTGEFGVLSLVELSGKEPAGYGIPLNYVWDGKNSIYFHCAPEGHKLNCLEACPQVTFCVIGHTQVLSRQFTTLYESILIRGTACYGLPAEERMHALTLLVEKYSPNDRETGMKYSEKSFHRTQIIRLDILHISGKTKKSGT